MLSPARSQTMPGYPNMTGYSEAYGSPSMAPQMMPPHYLPPPFMSPGMPPGLPGGYAGIFPQHFYGPPHSGGDAIAPFTSAYPHYPMFVHVSPQEQKFTQNIYEAPHPAPTEEPSEVVRDDSFTTPQ